MCSEEFEVFNIVVRNYLLTCAGITKSFFCSIKIPSNVIGRFTEILATFIRCDSHPNIWQSLSLMYSCLICVVTSLRKNEGKQLILTLRL